MIVGMNACLCVERLVSICSGTSMKKTLHLMYRNNVLFILLTTGQLDNG